jgi:hypothetical protein
MQRAREAKTTRRSKRKKEEQAKGKNWTGVDNHQPPPLDVQQYAL